MNSPWDDRWMVAITTTVETYRRMIDGTVNQLSDDQLHSRPRPDMNSVAVILRHLGGNLKSRWTDFLTTDGEKPDRDRDQEFTDWYGDRVSLMAYFDSGWTALTRAIQQIDASHVDQTIFIRGEQHDLALALTRSLTHLS